MRFSLRLLFISLLALSLLPGCGLLNVFKRKPSSAKQQDASPAQIGTITLVNPEASFVLIDNGYRMSPAVGEKLESRAPDGSIAQLRVTEIRKRPFVIADILRGIPGKGDLVFQAKKDDKPEGGADNQ